MKFLPFTRKTLFLALTGLLILALPLFIILLQRNQENRSNATAATTLALSLPSSNTPITQDDPITLTLTADPGTSNLLSIISFVITYDKTKVAPATIPFTLNPSLTGWKAVSSPKVDSTAGTISATYSVGNDPTQAIQKLTPLGTLSFTAIAGTEGQKTTIGFGSTSAVYSLGSSDTANENVLTTTVPVQFTITSTLLPTPTATPTPTAQVCAEVITTAVNDTTGECKEFPTACLPSGWHTVTACPAVSPTASPTATPTPTLVPDVAYLAVNLGLHGIGYAGDNATPGHQVSFSPTNPAPSNAPTQPTHTTRDASIQFYDAQNQLLYSLPTTLQFSPDTYAFGNILQFSPEALTILGGQPVSVRVSIPNYLTILYPLIVVRKSGTTNLPYMAMIAGNVYNDASNQNQLDILDYNAIMDCREDVDTANKSGTCSVTADINDDGKVDVLDYNLFIRELSTQNGR